MAFAATAVGCQTKLDDEAWPNVKAVTLTIQPETTWAGVPPSDPNPPERIPSNAVSFSTERFTHRTAGSDLIVEFKLSDDATFEISDGPGPFLPEEPIYHLSPSRKEVRLIWKSAPKEISQLLEAIQPKVDVRFDRTGQITAFLPGDNRGQQTVIEIGDFRKVPTGQAKRWNLRVTNYRVFDWPTGERTHYLTPSQTFPSGIWCYGLYQTGRSSSPFELIRFFVRESPDGIRIPNFGGAGDRVDEVYSNQTDDFESHNTVESYVKARFTEDPPLLSFESPGRPIAVIDQVEKGGGSDNAEMVKWVTSLPASENFAPMTTENASSRKSGSPPTGATNPRPTNEAEPARSMPTQTKNKGRPR